MTLDKLDEIEKLTDAWRDAENSSYARGREYALHQFIQAMREHALPLVKALREALIGRDEAYRERSDWMASIDRSKADIITLMHERDEARAEVARLQAQRDGLIAIMRATGLQVREWDRDGEPWITVLPEGCRCKREIGDAPCPLHKMEAS